MLARIWIAVGAIVCGIVVATLPGGSTSPWATVILVATVGVGLVATGFVLLSGYLGSRRIERSLHHGRNAPDLVIERPVLHDRDAVLGFLALVDERDLNWLRFEPFSGPWRDDRAAAFRAVAAFDTDHGGIFDAGLARATMSVVEAVHDFFTIYDAESVADPIMNDGLWRVVGRVGPDGTEVALPENEQIASQLRLRAAGVEIIEQRDLLVSMTRTAFPNPGAS